MWSFPGPQIKSNFHRKGMCAFAFPLSSGWRPGESGGWCREKTRTRAKGAGESGWGRVGLPVLRSPGWGPLWSSLVGVQDDNS